MKYASSSVKTFLLATALSLGGSARVPIAAEGNCTYRTWEWDTRARKSVGSREVRKLRRELTREERGETEGCTVCEEDQIEIGIEGVPPFRVCKALAPAVTRALERARAAGFPMMSAVGYRVGKSKGPVDAAGIRTEFSNHSYGTALDINSDRNGLYDECAEFGPGCRLIRGGEYRPPSPGAITRDSSIYSALVAEGFRWGGEMRAKQKDFMHFSLTGM